MKTSVIFVLFLTSCLSSKILAEEIDVAVHGRDIIVKSQGKAKVHNKNTSVDVGSIIKTDTHSLAQLTLPSNGKIILSPLSKVLIRSRTKQGRYLISLLKGDIFFQTKKGPPWTKRAAGAVINIRNYPTAYFGKAFRLNFLPHSKKENFIEVEQKPVKMVKLPSSP